MANPKSQHIHDVFELACDLPLAQAEALVRERCAAHPDVCAEVLALLALDRARAQLDALAGPDPGPPDALIGVRFGPFKLIRPLGQGGMGVVYLARQDPPGRDAAFKIIHSPFASANDRRRFDQEMQILARLQHPGIAAFYHTATWNDGIRTHTGYGMEFVRGLPLLDHAKEHKLSTRQRLELMVTVARAVQHAHESKIIHRDLKPANILVTSNHQPKVLDFGVARFLEADSHTLSGQAFGTPTYMSPEQANGDSRAVTPATDVYALGLILFKLLTASLPYPVQDQPRAEVLRVILTVEPRKIGSLRPDLRGDVETILTKALDREPIRRYQTAGELADELERFLRREPIRARAPTTWYILSRSAARHKAVTAGAVTTLLALVLGLGLALAARSQAVAAASALERRRWDIFDTPDRLLGAIDVQRLQQILNDGETHHDAKHVIDEVLIRPMLGGSEWESPDQVEANAALANGAANYYRDAEWFDRAESLFKQVIQIRTAQFGPEHPDVAASRANLAYLYTRMNRPADAEPLLAQAVPVLRRQSDPIWKPDFAGALDSLARTLLDRGRGPEAEQLYSEALALRRTLHGESHPFFGRALMNYARCLDEQGRHAEALPLLQRAQAILETTLKPDDLFIAMARASTASALISLGDLDQARAILLPLEPVLSNPMAPARLKERVYTGLIALFTTLERTTPSSPSQAAMWQSRFDAWKQRDH